MPPKSAAYYARQKKKDAKKKNAESALIKSEHAAAKPSVEARANLRQSELEAVKRQLEALNRTPVEIPANGDCLFLALLQQHALCPAEGFGATSSASELRQVLARHIKQHGEQFAPFVCLDGQTVESYCDKLASDPQHWGTDVELQAAAAISARSITVVTRHGTTVVGAATEAPQWVITFHEFLFTLGAHYNGSILKEEE